MPARYERVACTHFEGGGIELGDLLQMMTPVVAGRRHGVTHVTGAQEACYYWVDERGDVWDLSGKRTRRVGRLGDGWELVGVAVGLWREV